MMAPDRLAERLRCPRCGNRGIRVFFDDPNEPNARKKRPAAARMRGQKSDKSEMASPARLELATPGLGNQCSIRLSYGDVPTWRF